MSWRGERRRGCGEGAAMLQTCTPKSRGATLLVEGREASSSSMRIQPCMLQRPRARVMSPQALVFSFVIRADRCAISQMCEAENRAESFEAAAG